MKLDARRVDAFLRDPGAARVVLLHGDDLGLIRARAGELVRNVAGSSDDPFRVVELEREGFGRIADEVASLPLTGGRRVVRVRDATDAVTGQVQTVLGSPAAGLLVLEAMGLPGRGKLRTLVEKDGSGAAIGCYPLSGRALEDEISARLRQAGLQVDADALQWLGTQLGADLGVTRAEIAKLALYRAGSGRVGVDDARLCVGDLAGLSLDDALFAATAGDVAATDRAVELTMVEGASPVGVLRAALMHVQRLQRAQAAMGQGRSAGEAARAVRPPIFFRREAAFVRALQGWSARALERAGRFLWEAELGCKRTGAPAEMLARNAVNGLARLAAEEERRRRRSSVNGG